MVDSNGRLEGKRCFISGAAGGVGAATARRFCEEGAAVAVSDYDLEGVSELAENLVTAGFQAHPLALDVTDEDRVESTIAESARLLGGLDVVVPNAGILTIGSIEQLSPADFRRTLEVNLTGTFLVIRGAMPYLREAGGGAIVCVASQAGIEGVAEATAYCASKFGVVGIVESLARELTGEGIRVNAVAPGLVETPMLMSFYERQAEVHGGDAEKRLAEAVAQYPIGRLASPEEVADTIAFLASPLASYVSGTTLPVIGGQVS
jgi:NAD(P)-dependent dehydrogenase (short-subunit alcohol dehydrogenase family)